MDGLGEQCPFAFLDPRELFEQFALLGGQLAEPVRNDLRVRLLLFEQFTDPAFGDRRADPVSQDLKDVVVAGLVGAVLVEPEDP